MIMLCILLWLWGYLFVWSFYIVYIVLEFIILLGWEGGWGIVRGEWLG